MVKLGKNKKKDDENVEKPVEKPVEESGINVDATVPVDKTEDLEHKLLRLQADFDNFRKRVARERNETYTRANEDIMTELIPVIDHMEMAIKSAADHEAPQAILDGVSLVAEQLKGVLSRFGLELVDATAKEFDPNEHEAISHLPSDDFPDNSVMTQTRMGYKLKGRILRPAQVVVSSGRPDQAEPDDSETRG